MIIKLGQYGLFVACDNFPNCRNTIKLNKFLYEILKKEGINIYSWDYKCWRCNKYTKVYTYLINKQLKPYMEKHTELGSLGLDSLPPVDEYLKRKYKTINNNYSKTQNIYCTSNNCSHCNALIGNYYVVDDPHEILNDWLKGNLDKYIVENIPFNVFDIKEENLIGLENYFIQIF